MGLGSMDAQRKESWHCELVGLEAFGMQVSSYLLYSQTTLSQSLVFRTFNGLKLNLLRLLCLST